MRRILAAIAVGMMVAALGGCTTRTDKEKNKDYDVPRASGKADGK
jgi:hypothetical protein